jgi:hypothetical protein
VKWERCVPISFDQITNSSYLDFTGYRITNLPSNQPNVVEAAYGISPSDVANATNAHIDVALVLGRVQDPTPLLAENWAERRSTLYLTRRFNSTATRIIRGTTSFSGTAIFRCPRAGTSRACGSIPRTFRRRPTSCRALR